MKVFKNQRAICIFLIFGFFQCFAFANEMEKHCEGNDINLSGNPSGQEDEMLKKAIEENKLADSLPEEFKDCGGDHTAGLKGKDVWYEFLRGLAHVESKGKNCEKCGDMDSASIAKNGGSCGIFQMTRGDRCGDGNPTLSNPFNSRENINCATKEWAKIMKDKGKIVGNPYWGPCKHENQRHKCEDIIKAVKSKVCGGSYNSSSPLNWNEINPGSSGGGATK